MGEVFFLFLESHIFFGIDLIVLLEFEFLVFSDDNFGPELGEELVFLFLLLLSELGGFLKQ